MSKLLQTTASTVRNLDMLVLPEPWTSVPHRTPSPKHPSSLHSTPGLSKN